MDLAQLRDLLRIVSESDVAEVEVEQDGIKIVVRKSAPVVTIQQAQPFSPYGMGYMPAPYPPAGSAPPPPQMPQVGQAPAPAAPMPGVESAEAKAPAANEQAIKAPIVGTFYSAPSPDAGPFVQVGDTVKPGDVLCIIEAMKLMNEIEAEVGGTIKQVLAENGQPVEYDQPLFLIEKG